MTRLKHARAMQAKRLQTRATIRAAIDVLVQDAGHKPATVLRMIVETAADDLLSMAGARGAAIHVQRVGERVGRGYGLDA